MRVHSTNYTEPKSTKRMPFKLYISIMSHYSTPSCTVGKFISSARLLPFGHQDDHPPVCRYFGRIPNIARMFTNDSGILWPSDRKWITKYWRQSLKECLITGMYCFYVAWFYGVCYKYRPYFESNSSNIHSSTRFPEMRHEIDVFDFPKNIRITTQINLMLLVIHHLPSKRSKYFNTGKGFFSPKLQWQIRKIRKIGSNTGNC